MRSSSRFLGLVIAALLLIPTAQAVAAEFPLTVESEGSGEGTITSSPAGIDCGAECTAEFEAEETVTLTATPATGSEFVEWGEDCIGQVECEVTMDEARLVTAVFELEEIPLETFTEGTGSGEIECEVESGPAEECEFTYPFGTEIAFAAVPDFDSEFVEWGEDCSGSGVCEVTLDEEKSVTALFTLTFSLEVEKEGTGSGTVTSSPAGINCGGTCSAEFVEGETVTLTAAPASGSEVGDECEVTIERETTVTAIFDLEPPAPKFKLTVKEEGTGTGKVTSSPAGIECSPTCSAEFTEGTEVTLSASASVGSEFAGWSGSGCTGTGTCKVTMSAAKEVTATFNVEPASEFALTVALAGSGSGAVTSSPAGINCGIDCSEAYAAGTEVTLTATPASGSTFAGWSGDCTGSGSCKVTMSQARSVTATFEKVPTPPPGTAVVARTAKVKSGKAQLKLTCTGEGPCKGTLKLTAKIKSGGKTKNLTIGKGSFSLAAGAKKTLKVKLSGPAKKALAKGPLKAKVKGTGVRATTVKLKLAK
jgi:Divergent InlB B-repeat domain